MKRKLLIVLLSIVCALCLAFGLTACGNSSGGTTDGDAEEAASLEYTLSSDSSSYIVSGIGSVTSTTVTIPSTYNNKPVTAIADGAFKGNTVIVIIIIADSVTTIGENAFSGCTSITSATIGSGVTTIGASAFSGCSSLTSVNIPSSVTAIGANAFKDCVKIAIVIILGNPEIAEGAFSGCVLISDITLSDDLLAKLSEILNKVFADSSTITDVKDSTGETYHNYEGYSYNENEHWHVCTICGEKATSESHTLNSDNICSICGYEKLIDSVGLAYTLSDDKTYYTVSGIGTCNDTKLVIPSIYEGLPVTTISYGAFYDCTSLTSITIPDSVTSIGNGAFYSCTALTSITIPDSVTSIGNSALSWCTALTKINFNATAMNDLSSLNYVFYCAGQSGTGINVTVGANVTKIPAYLFCPYNGSDAPNITSVVFEDGSVCTSIGSDAFEGCTALTSITIPNSVTSIGDLAFFACASLESVTLPDSVTSIGSGAFSACTALESVTIGRGVTSISDYAFEYCTLLTSINVDSSNTAYKSIDGNLYNYDGTTLVQYAIGKTETSFTIPNSVTSIGDGAFYICTSLTSIDLPDSVTYIGTYAFYGCTALTSITIPDSVTSIGNSAFSWCTSLESITIPNSVTSIGYRAFYDCSKLTSVTFENTSGWYYASTEGDTSGTDILSSKLSDASTAAKYLRSTYCSYYWYRK